jgi:hypothetical protein
MGKTNNSRCLMNETPSASQEEVTIKYVCGIDIGSESCSGCVLRLDKRVVVKSSDFSNTKEGWKIWEAHSHAVWMIEKKAACVERHKQKVEHG